MFKRLLPLALALLLFVTPLLGAIPASAEETITVYVQTPSDWNYAHLYAWEGDSTMEYWPGIPMSYIDNNWWYADIPAGQYSNLIINDYYYSNDQTLALQMGGFADCWIVIDGNYETEDTYYTEIFTATVYTDAECTTIYDPNAENVDPISIYAFVPEDWNNILVWAWDDDNNSAPLCNTWPGELYMEYIGDNTYYAQVPGDYPHFLLTESGSYQTTDIYTNLQPGQSIWIDATLPGNPGVYYSMDELVNNCPHNVHDLDGWCKVCGAIVEHEYDSDGYCSCGDYREFVIELKPGDIQIGDGTSNDEIFVEVVPGGATLMESDSIAARWLLIIVVVVIVLILALLGLAVPVVVVVIIVIIIVAIVKKKKQKNL